MCSVSTNTPQKVWPRQKDLSPGQTRATLRLVPRKTPLVECVDAQMLAAAEAGVRANNALPLTRVCSVKLSPSARDELVKQLVSRGLERTAKVVRVPLALQIEALVRGGARIARKDLARRVKGATKTEIDASLGKLIREGRGHLVVRTQTEVLVGPGECVLGSTEMQQWSKAVTTLAKTVKKVQTKGLPKTLLREDLDAVLGSSAPTATSVTPNSVTANSVTANSVTSNEGSERLVVETLQKLEDPNLKLVRIADLVRALEPRLPKDEVHRALAKAFEVGTIELRPDAGTEFLKAEDVALCLPGPRGTVFSYARRMSS